MNTTIAIAILAFWAVLATAFMIAALRSRAATERLLTTVRRDRDKALDIADGFRTENQRLLREFKPARDGSDGPTKSFDPISFGRALRTITGPVKPSSARTPSTSRNDSPDVMGGMAMGSLVAPGGWSAPDPTPAPAPAPDCSPSPSFSSGDSGSCGGGE